MFAWANQHMDFLKAPADAQVTLNLMHQMLLTVESSMKDYHDTELIAAVVEQALKFCVQASFSDVIVCKSRPAR